MKKIVNTIGTPTDGNLTAVARQIKQILDVREGQVGDPLDANVTFRDLVDSGLAEVSPSAAVRGASPIAPIPSAGSSSGSEPDLSAPPQPSGFSASPSLATVLLQWDDWVYSNHAYAEVWRSSDNVIGNAVLIGISSTRFYTDPIGQTGVTKYYWLRFVSKADIRGPYHSSTPVSATTGKIGSADLGPLIVEAGNLASGAVTGSKLAALAVDLTKFANGIEPVSIAPGPVLPTVKSTNAIYFNGELYRWNGSAYSKSVPAADITGQLNAAQLAIEIGGGNLVRNSSFEVDTSGDGLADHWQVLVGGSGDGARTHLIQRLGSPSHGTYVQYVEITAAGNGSDSILMPISRIPVVGGKLHAVSADLRSNANPVIILRFFSAGGATLGDVVLGPFAPSTYTARRIVAGLAAAPSGSVECELMFRGFTAVGQYIAVDSVQLQLGDMHTAYAPRPDEILAGTITATEIADNAVTTPKLVAGAVVAGKIAADAVATNNLQAGAVTAQKLLAGSVTTSKLLVVPPSLCPDPYFSDEAWWAGTLLDANGWYFEPGTTTGTAKHAGLWSGHPTNAPGTARKHVWSGRVAAPAPGTSVRLRARAANNSNQDCYVQVRFRNGSGVELGADMAITIPAGASAVADYVAKGTIVANTATMEFIIYNAAGAAFTGACFVGAIMFDVAASADLIVDGAVSAASLAADAVVAGKIAAGAVNARELAAGSVTADKLLVTGRGKALNDDPTFQDASAWSQWAGGGSYALVAEASSPAGGRVLRATNDVQFRARAFPVVGGSQYKVSCWARQTSGAGGFWLRFFLYDSAGANVGYVVTAVTPAIGNFEGIDLPTGWTKYTGKVIAPANAATGWPIVYVNWQDVGVTDIADLRYEEFIGADLIVDGAIQANHLAANSIAVGTAAIQNGAIVNAMIADATIDSAKVANLDAAKITAGTLDANRIAAGSLDSKIANLDAAVIQTGTIGSARIGDGSISTAKIGDGQITTAKIGDGQVTTAKIGSAQIKTANIDDAQITTLKLGIGSATSMKTLREFPGTIAAGGTASELILGSVPVACSALHVVQFITANYTGSWPAGAVYCSASFMSEVSSDGGATWGTQNSGNMRFNLLQYGSVNFTGAVQYNLTAGGSSYRFRVKLLGATFINSSGVSVGTTSISLLETASAIFASYR